MVVVCQSVILGPVVDELSVLALKIAVESNEGDNGLEGGRPAKNAVIIFRSTESCKRPLARSRYSATKCSVFQTDSR